MNCEQVEERLSAYLDNMLAPAERRDVTIHLQSCPRCMSLLAELRQNDILLTQLPRYRPSPELRARLFALPEVQQFFAEGGQLPFSSPFFGQTQPLTPALSQTLDERVLATPPRLVSLPGGRGPQSSPRPLEPEIPPTPPTLQLTPASRSYPTRQISPPRRRRFTPWSLAVAAVLVLVLAGAGLVSITLATRPGSANLTGAGAITPPAGPLVGQNLPLAAGTRFVFLRNGTLWSTLTDGDARQPERLTPVSVQVAAGWVVNPSQGNHDAGDLLAYIDLLNGRVHTIRSDGQQDTPVPLALLKNSNSASWQSVAGQTILHSLAWSPDSSLLAFVADPTGSGQTSLYLFTPATETVRMVAVGANGSVAAPVWSPDGARLAFTLTHNAVVSVLDYNVRNHSALELSNFAASRGNSADGVLSLNWYADGTRQAVTWCLGSIGHISSVWMHRVGTGSTTYPQLLTSGDYLQALYSAGSNNQTGGWLLVASVAGRPGDLLRLSLAAGGQPVALSQGQQVGFARWSPDGSTVFYLDNVTNGAGRAHLVNVITGSDQLLPDQATLNPVPDWSADNLQIAYSTGTRIDLVHTLNGGQLTRLSLQGSIADLSWSPATLHQLIVVLGSPAPGLYSVDTQKNAFARLDQLGADSAIQWTQIP